MSKSNRLSSSSSPYLRQHGHQDVDWWSWCPEALDLAKRENKLILVSIGYSTCHWCHVMSHDSFDDKQVAKLMNKHIVSIKIDREERPDLDEMLMQVCQKMTGRGGWPLNVFLTPDLVPVHAATFIPKENKYGMLGMLELIPRIAEIWKLTPEKLLHQASHFLEKSVNQKGELSLKLPMQARDAIAGSRDETWGGRAGKPKFPSLHEVRLLFRGNDAGIDAGLKTLDGMIAGGIHDHLGGGFHRYSTDERWFLPHFEKMLYDQANALYALAEAAQLSDFDRYEHVARHLVNYVFRDLGSDSGLYSAEDADSEGEEGTFYVWTQEEATKILGAELATKFHVQPDGNWVEESSREKMTTNILTLGGPGMATWWNTDRSEILAPALAHRAARIRPHRDDKIILEWNAFFLAALAFANRVFGGFSKELQSLETAIDQGFGPAPTIRIIGSTTPAMLDDLVMLALAKLEIGQANFDEEKIEHATRLALDAAAKFASPTGLRRSNLNELPSLEKDVDAYDGAMPSPVSTIIEVLARCGFWSDEAAQKATEIADMYSGSYAKHPSAHAASMRVLPEILSGATSLILGAGYEIQLANVPAHVNVHSSTKMKKMPVGYDEVGEEEILACRNRSCQKIEAESLQSWLDDARFDASRA